MLKTSTVLSIVVFLFFVMVFPAILESGESGGSFPGGYFGYRSDHGYGTHHNFFGPHPNSYGRRYLRHYYLDYPYDERSPYQDLVIRPAGQLQISVEPAHAQVFVDGYAVEKEDGFLYTIGLLTGAHSVKVIAEGYKPHREEVRIEKGKQESITVKLTK
jgi:hypothetical protein